MNGKTPKLVKPGDPIRASDFNDIQRALAPINGQGGNFQSLIQSPFLESGWVWVKNDTATAVARFETMRLKTEDLLSFSGFDLAGDSRGIILKITDVSTFASPTLAIPLEPIAAGGVGRACISGLCRAKLLSGSTSLKNATVSGRKLQPASSGPVSLLSTPSSSDETTALIFIDRATGGSLVRIFMTPSGGIAAGGSATCTEYSEDLTTSLGTTATVWNHRSSVIAGSVLVLVMSGATKLWVVEGNCPIEITEPEEPPVGEP
jgi:hypothetical protein